MSPFAAFSGLPLSSDSSSASCSPLALISSASAYIRPGPLRGADLAQRALERRPRGRRGALDVLGAGRAATSQIGSPVAGSIVSNVRPSAASTRSPPMTRSADGPRRTRGPRLRAPGRWRWPSPSSYRRGTAGPAARSAALDQRQRPDHGRRGDRDAQVPPGGAVGVREPAGDSPTGCARRGLGRPARPRPSTRLVDHAVGLSTTCPHPSQTTRRTASAERANGIRTRVSAPHTSCAAADLANRLARPAAREIPRCASVPRAAD